MWKYCDLIQTIVFFALCFGYLGIPYNPVWGGFLWVFTLMVFLYCSNCLPPAVTSLVPLFLFPLLNVLDGENTSMMYLHESNVVMMGSLFLSLATEMSGLTKRVALIFIKVVGCKYRVLFFLFGTFTMFLSILFSNTLVTAMMFPLARSILEELEGQGLAEMYLPLEEESEDEEKHDELLKVRKPTKITICFYLSAAYYSTVGGLLTPLSSSTNLLLFHEVLSKYSVTFKDWVKVAVLPTFLLYLWTTIWLMVYFTGLCSSRRQISFSDEQRETARQGVREKLTAMGRVTFYEIMILLVIILTFILTLTRDFGTVNGWWDKKKKPYVGHASVISMMVILLFLLPSSLNFLNSFDPDETKRPKAPGPGLLTTKYIEDNMPWQTILMMGGTLALGQAFKAHHVFQWFGSSFVDHYSGMSMHNAVFIQSWFWLLVIIFTQFMATDPGIIVLVEEYIPYIQMKFAVPLSAIIVSLASSFGFFLPVSSHSNAIVAAWGNVDHTNFMKTGVLVILCGWCAITLAHLLFVEDML